MFSNIGEKTRCDFEIYSYDERLANSDLTKDDNGNVLMNTSQAILFRNDLKTFENVSNRAVNTVANAFVVGHTQMIIWDYDVNLPVFGYLRIKFFEPKEIIRKKRKFYADHLLPCNLRREPKFSVQGDSRGHLNTCGFAINNYDYAASMSQLNIGPPNTKHNSGECNQLEQNIKFKGNIAGRISHINTLVSYQEKYDYTRMQKHGKVLGKVVFFENENGTLEVFCQIMLDE